MESNFGNTMASMLQFWNWLKNKRNEDNKMSRRVWETVKAKAEKNGMAKTKRRIEIRKEEKSEKKKMIDIKKIV